MSTFSSSSGDGGHTLGFGSRSAGPEEEKIEVSPIKEEVAAAAAADAAGATTAVVDGGNRNMQDRRGMKLPGATTRDWSSLPKPAIQLILMGLRPSLADSFSFAGVCKEWRSVYIDCKRELFSSLPPLLIDCFSSLPPRLIDCASANFYSLFDRGFVCWKPPIPRRLLCPASGLRYGSDWCVIGVSHGYWVIMTDSERIPVFLLLDPLFPESPIELPLAPHFKLGEYSRALMTAPPTSPGCVVVVTETYGFWYCQPGDTEWVHHDFSHEDYYLELCHVAVLGRQLYTLASGGTKVVVVELLFPRPRVTVMDVEGLDYNYHELHQFVESAGEILYISHDGDWWLPGGCNHRVIVWRLDLPARRWVTLDTLGKRSIFLPQYKKFKGWLGTPVTCVGGGAAEWGGREDCIYIECSKSTLMVWSMKDGSVEHHPWPEESYLWEWLVPSFCYA